MERTKGSCTPLRLWAQRSFRRRTAFMFDHPTSAALPQQGSAQLSLGAPDQVSSLGRLPKVVVGWREWVATNEPRVDLQSRQSYLPSSWDMHPEKYGCQM